MEPGRVDKRSDERMRNRSPVLRKWGWRIRRESVRFAEQR